jgi:gas vesicle protein GvpL/GvpF
MKQVVIGVHLVREDVEPVAEAIAAGDLWFSGLSVPDDQPLGDRDLLLRVAKIRAALLDRATFIAVRYGFATPSGAPAPSPALLSQWRALLEANRDNVEMTLKVAATSPKPRPRREDFSSGAAYLRALHESGAEVDDEFRQSAEKAIDAIEHRWIPRDNASLELAFLVPRSRVAAVRAAGEQLKRDFPRIPFLLSGPWPLEVFADADRQ